MQLKQTGTQWDRDTRNDINDNWDTIANNFNGAVQKTIDEAKEQVIDELAETAKLIWVPAVENFADIDTTYPNPEEGWTVNVSSEGNVYRYDGSNWVQIQGIDPGPYNELSSQLADIETELETLRKYDTTVVHQIFVDGTNGDDENGGSTDAPLKTIAKALERLRGMSEIVVDGVWEIRLRGTFTQGHRIRNLPRFRFPLKFIGETDENGNPTTFFDGTNASSKIALWIEPLMDLNVEIYNLKFSNYTNSFNGYGILAKGHGKIFVFNCIADNCDIGYGAIRNVDFTFRKCKAIDCLTSGFRAQYSSSGTFGSETEGLDLACEAINCPQGIYVSRNAVAHIDYCVLDSSSYAGVLVDQSSRVHVMGSDIKNNEYGVRVEGGGEWINNTTNTNTFTNNTHNYGHFGNGRETRLYSQTSQNEYRVGVTTEEVVHTGTTSQTIIYLGSALGIIPKDFFKTENQRLRFVISGTITGTGTKLFNIFSTSLESTSNTTIMHIPMQQEGGFIIECIVYPIGNELVHVVAKSLNHSGDQRVYIDERNFSTDIERVFRLTCTLDNSDTTVTFKSFETFLMG